MIVPGGTPSAARRGHRRQRVLHVEEPGQPRLDLERPIRRLAGERGAARVEAHPQRAVVGLALDRVRGRVRQLLREPAAVGVVQVHHRHALVALEQPALGGEVALHVLVEVEVILRQVGEDPAGEVDALRAPELQRVGGDLHGAGAVARVEHAAECGLEVDRLGRGALHRLVAPAHDGLHGAEQSGLHPGRLEQRAHQERRRRLAVRAGHAHHDQVARGIAVEARGHGGHRRPHVGHDHLRHPEPQRPLADQRNGAPLDRRRRRSRAHRRGTRARKKRAPPERRSHSNTPTRKCPRPGQRCPSARGAACAQQSRTAKSGKRFSAT